MNKRFTALLLAFTVALASVSAQSSFTEAKAKIAEHLNNFSQTMLSAIPQAATQQNVWADAYIGNVFPSAPPHFGGGLSFGGTMFDFRDLKAGAKSMSDMATTLTGQTVSEFDTSFLPDNFFLPVATVDLRIGGVFLPFDVGLCILFTNTESFQNDVSDLPNLTANLPVSAVPGMSMDYVMIGGDIRYCVYQGSVIMPKISVGAGFYYTKAAFCINTGSSDTKAKMNFSFESKTLFLQAQASKKILFLDIFVGARGIISCSTDGWYWGIWKDFYGSTYGTDDTGVCNSGGGANAQFDFANIQPQIYAGVGLKFLCFELDASICADVSSGFKDTTGFIWSGALSLHASL